MEGGVISVPNIHPKIHLRRTKRVLAGHLWIFSNEIYEGLKNYAPGSVVDVYGRQEEFLGTGYINPNSLIAVRLLSRTENEIRNGINKDFLRKRLTQAIELRKKLFASKENLPDAVRLVYSEGDYLPGLIVDKYGDCLVLQFLTYGMEALREHILELMDEMLNPRLMVLRNDGRSRSLEGLPLGKEVLKGDPGSLPVINEEGILFEIDPLEGQKTGFFLDQRDNRTQLRKLIRSGRGLDLFCYSGGWALNAAYSGADVTGVDESERAVGYAGRNAGLNSLKGTASFIKANVFSHLDSELAAGEKRYDFIVLDPPAFVKSAARIKEAEKAYRQLNNSCMKLIKPGGILASSSCSYHMGREMFVNMLNSAARDAGRSLRLISLSSQCRDHPILLSMPETEYLKCAFLIVD